MHRVLCALLSVAVVACGHDRLHAGPRLTAWVEAGVSGEPDQVWLRRAIDLVTERLACGEFRSAYEAYSALGPDLARLEVRDDLAPRVDRLVHDLHELGDRARIAYAFRSNPLDYDVARTELEAAIIDMLEWMEGGDYPSALEGYAALAPHLVRLRLDADLTRVVDGLDELASQARTALAFEVTRLDLHGRSGLFKGVLEQAISSMVERMDQGDYRGAIDVYAQYEACLEPCEAIPELQPFVENMRALSEMAESAERFMNGAPAERRRIELPAPKRLDALELWDIKIG